MMIFKKYSFILLIVTLAMVVKVESLKGLNEPCKTRNSCEDELTCLGGRCLE